MNTIVLTGACSGLGKSVQKFLLSDRYSENQRIFLCRTLDCQESASESVQYLSHDFLENFLDVSSLKINPNSKKILLINNAASIGPIDNAIRLTDKQISDGMQINFVAPLKLTQELTKTAINNNAKLVVLNITTGAIANPVGGWLVYSASKAAIKIALDIIAIENLHVRIIHYDPGIIDTSMQKEIRKSTIEKMPSVEKFKEYKVFQKLRSPEIVAGELNKIILEI